MNADLARTKARNSLQGLSVGDAFGELFFSRLPNRVPARTLPPGPWPWTDDTHMALSVVEVLDLYGCIDQDALAHAFARRFVEEPHRGYAGGAARLLSHIAQGADWRTVSPALFHGGSFGNGGAMRAAPIGGYYYDDPQQAAEAARLSAAVTHAHPEGQAGAIAVAVAAATAAQDEHPSGLDYLKAVLEFMPAGETRNGIELAMRIPAEQHGEAVWRLGTGNRVTAQDTVPFCLWSAAYHLHDFEAALWWTAQGQGDVDTTCAIVGGIVGLSAPDIPADWVKRREPLPI